MAFIVGGVVYRAATMPSGTGWIDSFVFIDGARYLLHAPLHVYDDARVQLSLGVPGRSFIYPPAALIPFVPLAVLADHTSIGLASLVWLTIEGAALVATFVLLVRRLNLPASISAPLALVLAAAAATSLDVISGQVNGVVMLLVVVAALRFPNRSAGVLLGLALAFKPVAPLIIIVPLVRRQWRLTAIAVATAAVVTVPLGLLLGWAQMRFYVADFLPGMSGLITNDPNNLSPANLLTTWVGGRPLAVGNGDLISSLTAPGLASALLIAVRLTIAALALRCAAIAKTPLWAFAIVLATVPLLSGTAWIHYYVYEMPMAICISSALAGVRRRWFVVALGIILIDPLFQPFIRGNLATDHSLAPWTTFLHAQFAVVATTAAFLGGTAWWVARSQLDRRSEPIAYRRPDA